MKIKLGPYKVTREFWQAMQDIPGPTDEHRVLAAIDFTMKARQVERQRRAEAVRESLLAETQGEQP